MKEINGTYTSAKIFTDSIDTYAAAQVQLICDHISARGSFIRIMPDVHPGQVGPIGLTMTFKEQLLPALLGIDIGCGMTCAVLNKKKIEYQRLDTVIREQVPCGMNIRHTPLARGADFPYEKLRCAEHINLEKAMCSVGTLGGGNHFIEIDKDTDGALYLTIHSGSRRLGKEVTEYYLHLGQKELKSRKIPAPWPLIWLDGRLLTDFLHDVFIVQEFALENRLAILETLCKYMKWKPSDVFSCPHNYVEQEEDHYLLRKGSVSARKGERILIPANMRDGILLCEGKGNPDWNFSAPHGSGRILKREDVSKRYTLSQFKSEMKGIHCSCIGKDTLDEAPFAYRDIAAIASRIEDTAVIQKILTPVYNYKAGSRT
ncbi:MAG TPA: RNA-splicing ligase RtcB [Lachnospiraceae bacterium]|nr:RNA-splicing ligase RtcB [Lachnospiraceae bacterium]